MNLARGSAYTGKNKQLASMNTYESDSSDGYEANKEPTMSQPNPFIITGFEFSSKTIS